MLVFNGWRNHCDVIGLKCLQYEPSFGGVYLRPEFDRFAKASDLDPQSSAVRFIYVPRAKRPGQKLLPRGIPGPGLTENTHQCEQDRTTCQKGNGFIGAYDIPARINDECM